MAKTFNFIGTAERRVVSQEGGIEFTLVPEPGALAAAPVYPTAGGKLVVESTDEIPFDDGFDYLSHDPEFTLVACKIRISCGAHGTVSPAVDTDVNVDADLDVTFTPATDYHVADIVVDGVSVGTGPVYSFVGVNDVHTISGTFAHD